jgi:hypothetical protein
VLTNVELNEDIKQNIETFFQSDILGKKVSFINRQRENPDPNESALVELVDVSDAEAIIILDKLTHQIWGKEC